MSISKSRKPRSIVVTVPTRSQLTVSPTPLRLAQTLTLLESFYPTERETILRHAIIYFGLNKEKL